MFKVFKKVITISELVKLYESEDLDLEPSYQRNSGVWPKEKKQLLIDSVLNGIDLPKFYTHVFPKEKGGKFKYAVIDGKQRIDAIIGFYKNEYPLKKDFAFLDLDENHGEVAGLFFREVQEQFPRLASKFLLFELDFVMIDTESIDLINTMFVRINAGVPVNAAEKRNAFGGRLIQTIHDVCTRNTFFTILSFKDSRNSYQDLFLKLFLIEHHGGTLDLSEKNLNQVLLDCKDCMSNEFLIVQQVEERLEKIGRSFSLYRQKINKSNAVVFYLFLRDKDLDDGKLVGFLKNFEFERKNNKQDTMYQEYNRLIQQGAYKKASIEGLLIILEEKYADTANE